MENKPANMELWNVATSVQTGDLSSLASDTLEATGETGLVTTEQWLAGIADRARISAPPGGEDFAADAAVQMEQENLRDADELVTGLIRLQAKRERRALRLGSAAVADRS